MKELLFEKGFWLTALAAFFGIAAGLPVVGIELPLAAGSFLNFFMKALESKVLLFLIPILAVFPMGAVYVRESSGGFIKLYISRMSRMEYIERKLVQIYGAGFLIFFFAGLLLLLVSFMCIYPFEKKGELTMEMVWEALLPLLRVSMAGGILSGISGIFAEVFCNYYMAYGLPFVCYYLLIIIKERYLPRMYAFYPPEWIKCGQYWGVGNSGIWVFLVMLSAVVMLINGLLLHYRLREV